MSYVTNYILTTMVNDGGAEALPAHCVEVSDQSGGGKAMEVDVYLWAENYSEVITVQRMIANIIWEYPEDVQLMVKGQYEDLFTVWSLEDLEKEL